MTASQGSILDGPPPSPASPVPDQTLTPGAAPQMPSFDQMAQPLTAGTPGRATTPEVAMGIMQSAETISGMFDSMASIVPDLANDFALLKDLLQRTMGKLLVNGGQPASPNAIGQNFPGGGFLSGAR
jgi:hypothetical protein